MTHRTPGSTPASGPEPVYVLIPARDEEASLPGLIAAMPDSVTAVVVVDNGSRDSTRRVAEGLGAHVLDEPRRGYGAACLAGLRWLGELADPGIVVFVDADHGEAPAQIDRLIQPLVSGQADMVLGTRRAADGSMPVHARLGNRLVLGLVSFLFGHRFQDLSPFRAIRYTSLSRLDMDDRDWGWTLQMQIRAGVRGLTVAEIPALHGPRTSGDSKISGSLIGSVRAGRKMFWTLFRERCLVDQSVGPIRRPGSTPANEPHPEQAPQPPGGYR